MGGVQAAAAAGEVTCVHSGLTLTPAASGGGMWDVGRWAHKMRMPVVPQNGSCHAVHRHKVCTGFHE